LCARFIDFVSSLRRFIEFSLGGDEPHRGGKVALAAGLRGRRSARSQAKKALATVEAK
jgi:hypothetical protein